MQNIPRAIVPNISIAHGAVKNICFFLFLKVVDCALVV